MVVAIQSTISMGDLFTGLSVLVSAGGIVGSTVYDRWKRRKEARAAVMNLTLQSLMKVFENGLALSEKISWEQVGEDNYSSREIIEFGFQIKNQIRSLRPNYLIWADENENTVLNSLEEYVARWQERYTLYLNTHENIPKFDELLTRIEGLIGLVSKMIHDTF